MNQSGHSCSKILTAAAAASAAAVLTVSPAHAVEQGQWWHQTWQMSQVWQLADGAGVTVAVLDTGVDAAISELDGAVIPGTELVDGHDGDGRVDHDPDRGGHGTRVASLIAGRGGDTGFTGVAPAATILPVTVMGTTPQFDIGHDLDAEGIRYAVDNGAQVINMSSGTVYDLEPCPRRVAAAVRYALSEDVVVVSSAGNIPDGDTRYPAACDGVLTVGAVDRNLAVWEDSHRSEHVDLAAPGVDLSTIARDGEVRYGQGTSIASALVAGVVALVRQHYPDASAHEVVTRILATAQDLGAAGPDSATGHGMVRPYEALTADIPSDTPNPVYDDLDLTDTRDPGASTDGFTPPDRPDVPAAADPAAPDQEHGSPLLLAAAGVTAFLLLAAAGVTVWLLLVRRRRTARIPIQPTPPQRSSSQNRGESRPV